MSSDDAKELGIVSTTRTVRRVVMMPRGLKSTKVIEKKVSLARVAPLDRDDAEDEGPPRSRRR